MNRLSSCRTSNSSLSELEVQLDCTPPICAVTSSVAIKRRRCVAIYGKPIAELRSVTCHMRSHSVTCHPTKVNAPRHNPSQTERYLIHLPRRDRKLWSCTYSAGHKQTWHFSFVHILANYWQIKITDQFSKFFHWHTLQNNVQ